MATYKTEVFERLFRARWDEASKTLDDRVITLREISKEIESYNQRHGTDISTRNPANFFKDFIRNISLANLNWPPYVIRHGFTAASVKGENGSFRFVRAPSEKPFAHVDAVSPREPLLVQTLTIPPLARELGRKDEAWLMQVVDRLNIVQMHLVRSPVARELGIEYVEQLQLGIKQLKSEIDGLYLAQTKTKRGIILTVEAKVRDDIYLNQIEDQVEAAQIMMQDRNDIDHIIPMAIKVEERSIIRVVQFRPIGIREAGVPISVDWPESYRLWPTVGGI